jgi:hypothetical protein
VLDAVENKSSRRPVPSNLNTVVNGGEVAGKALSGAFFHAPHYTKYANQVTSE